MICDQNKLPLCISNIEMNKTAKHEIKNIQRTINNKKISKISIITPKKIIIKRKT